MNVHTVRCLLWISFRLKEFSIESFFNFLLFSFSPVARARYFVLLCRILHKKRLISSKKINLQLFFHVVEFERPLGHSLTVRSLWCGLWKITLPLTVASDIKLIKKRFRFTNLINVWLEKTFNDTGWWLSVTSSVAWTHLLWNALTVIECSYSLQTPYHSTSQHCKLKWRKKTVNCDN